MAKRKLTMRKIKEIIRLKEKIGLSDRQIARSLKISHSTVGIYVGKIKAAKLNWEKAQEMSEGEILEMLNQEEEPKKPESQRPIPDWEEIEKELTRKGVTRRLLWEEYLADNPEGYRYTQFCEHYNRWIKAQDKPVLRKPVKAGEKAEVDYAGQTMAVVDPRTGEIQKAEVFVGVIGASGLIYTEAHWKQNLSCWTHAHVRMFNYFGGVPEYIIPDNLKAGVKSACYYEPDINPTYHELARHYQVAVIPARVRKPKDKGLVENAVQQIERWVLAPLRNRKFFSLAELNKAIKDQLAILNNRKRTDNGKSRRELFEELDRPVLGALPEYPYEYSEVKYAKVHIDYHVTFNKHQYSVPHTFCGKKVLIRATEKLVEVFRMDKDSSPQQRQCIAIHPRCDRFGYTTQKSHMPENHAAFVKWSPERFIHWAQKYGENTAAVIETVLGSRKHPQQAFRSCQGILGLARKHGNDYLEQACKLALREEVFSYRAIKAILEMKKDMLMEEPTTKEPLIHQHVRGHEYYN